MKSIIIAIRIWVLTSFVLAVGVFLWSCYANNGTPAAGIVVFAASLIISLPALFFIAIALAVIIRRRNSFASRISWLISVQFSVCITYGWLSASVTNIFTSNFLQDAFYCTGILFSCSLFAFALTYKRIAVHFSENLSHQQIQTNMETNFTGAPQHISNPMQASSSNRLLLKALITGGLILALLIPTFFISDLVTERQERRDKAQEDAGTAWAGAQTLTAPYFYIPSTDNRSHIIVLPDNLSVSGNITPENRERSIYKLLFYSSNISGKGDFKLSLPDNVQITNYDFSKAQLCMGLSDFKGIEDKVVVQFNGNNHELSPGLPTNEIDSNGLSAPVNLATATANDLSFSFALNVKGSGRLHFIPAAGNSSFNLQSTWPSPSFDGVKIPSGKAVSDSGFTASWKFNKVNLPFGTVLTNGDAFKAKSDFGVSILQPIDEYAQTARCIKYAIMFIGLTFSLFFIIEIMQKKPFHPVQYVLVGLALVIFYSLLLSISELIAFSTAYTIAAVATVTLISLYAKSHFKSWKIAATFTIVLGALYAFNYVLISLEDTALLVGSCALFIVLAIVMYASRKINWYGTPKNLIQETVLQ